MSEMLQTQKGAQAKNKGLGRGLGSLLGSTEEGAFGKGAESGKAALKSLAETVQTPKPAPVTQKPVESEAPVVPAHLRVWQIGIEKIEPHPNQPRQIFNKEPLDELAQSIREKGVLQPLIVRKRGLDSFEIIAGERRWRAAQLAGLKEVPAILKDTTDQEVLELALIENIQREDLNVIEEAEAYDFLLKKHNLTQQELAQKVGKDRATIANVLRLLQLQPSVRLMVSRGQLSLGQAKVLLSVADQKTQESLAQKALKETLSVRVLEKLASKANRPQLEDLVESTDLRQISAKNLQEELQKLLGSKVNLDYSNGKGKISIHFYSDQELNQVAERLRKSWQQS